MDHFLQITNKATYTTTSTFLLAKDTANKRRLLHAPHNERAACLPPCCKNTLVEIKKSK